MGTCSTGSVRCECVGPLMISPHIYLLINKYHSWIIIAFRQIQVTVNKTRNSILQHDTGSSFEFQELKKLRRYETKRCQRVIAIG